MTGGTVHGVARAVLLSRTVDIRGTAAEFRHLGTVVVSHDEVLEALLDVARDPDSVLIVSSDFDRIPLSDMLNLAVAVCGSAVMLGLGAGDAASALRVALSAGVHATVELPVTPARLRQALRLLAMPENDRGEVVAVGDLTVDPGRHEVVWQGVRVDLPPREFAILYALTRAHPYLATVEQLAEEYGGIASDPISAIRVAIRRVRTRLTEAGVRPDPAIETVRGIGYRLVS